ncbi:hypothetical protein D3C71_1552050 [compost metagenome]
MLAAGAVKQAGNETAAQLQIRHGELVQPFHGAKLLRQPRQAHAAARSGDDVAKLAQIGGLLDQAVGVYLDDQAHGQCRAVGQHAFKPRQERALRQRRQGNRHRQRRRMGEQPVQSQADSLYVAFGRQAQANRGRHENRSRNGIAIGRVVQHQAGFMVQQFALHRMQRQHR